MREHQSEVRSKSIADNRGLAAHTSERTLWLHTVAGLIAGLALIPVLPAVAAGAENTVVLPGQNLSFPPPTDSEKFRRNSPHFDDESQNLFLIEEGQLVSYQVAGRSLQSREVIMPSVDDFAIWRMSNRTVIVALRQQLVSIVSLDGMVIHQVSIALQHGRFGSFGNYTASIPIVGSVQGEFRLGTLNSAFEFELAPTTLANGWIAKSVQSQGLFCFPASLNNQPRGEAQSQPPNNCAILDDKFIVASNHSLPSMFVPFCTMNSPRGDMSGRLLGVQFDESMTRRRIGLWSPDEPQALLLTPPGWDCYGPVASHAIPECVGFQRTISRASGPLSKVDIYSRAELCLSLRDTIIVLSPCSGGDGNDWNWSTSGKSIVMLGPDMRSDWNGTEVLTLFEIR